MEYIKIIADCVGSSIAWVNSNMIGVLSLIGAAWAACKSIGYFERKQVEKEMRLVEETYISLMKALDVLEDIKSQSITMDKKLLDGLRKNPQLCIAAFIDSLNDSYNILETHRNVFTDLYEHQLQMSLFFKDAKYTEPLLLTIAVYRHVELLLRGIKMLLGRLADAKNKFPPEMLGNDCIDFASELWENITPTETQIKRFDEGDSSQDVQERTTKGRNSNAIKEARTAANVYKEWLEKQMRCYRKKQSN